MTDAPEIGTQWVSVSCDGLFPRLIQVERVDTLKTATGFPLVQSRVLEQNGIDLRGTYRWTTHVLGPKSQWSDFYTPAGPQA